MEPPEKAGDPQVVVFRDQLVTENQDVMLEEGPAQLFRLVHAESRPQVQPLDLRADQR